MKACGLYIRLCHLTLEVLFNQSIKTNLYSALRRRRIRGACRGNQITVITMAVGLVPWSSMHQFMRNLNVFNQWHFVLYTPRFLVFADILSNSHLSASSVPGASRSFATLHKVSHEPSWPTECTETVLLDAICTVGFDFAPVHGCPTGNSLLLSLE